MRTIAFSICVPNWNNANDGPHLQPQSQSEPQPQPIVTFQSEVERIACGVCGESNALIQFTHATTPAQCPRRRRPLAPECAPAKAVRERLPQDGAGQRFLCKFAFKRFFKSWQHNLRATQSALSNLSPKDRGRQRRERDREREMQLVRERVREPVDNFIYLQLATVYIN